MGKRQKASFTGAQTRIVWSCTLIYVAAYFNRLNLSAALGSMRDALGINGAQAGLMQTAFAVAYAVGQLINGALVDRMHPLRHMLTGLLGSALCNLGMGLSGSFYLNFALCLLNGAFQSMLWTPIVRMLVLYFENGACRTRANFYLSMTLVAGHLGAWALAGAMSSWFDWRFSFIVPAVLAALTALAARMMLRGMTFGKAERTGAEGAAAAVMSVGETLRFWTATGFFLVLFGAVLYGFVCNGIVTWAPTVLQSVSSGDMSSAAFSLIIPCINIVGIVLGYTSRDKVSSRRMTGLMLLLTAVLSLLMRASAGVVLLALLMGVACASLYGVNPMLTGLIPLEYEATGRVGLTAGLADSCIYLGSALTGVLGGAIMDAWGVNMLYMVWAAVAAVGGVLTLLSGTNRRTELLKKAGS